MQDRIDGIISKAQSVAGAMNQFYTSAAELRDIWNAEAFGKDAANELTQDDINAGAHAGMDLSRLRGAMTQVFSFCTFYEGAVKGEIDKMRRIA